MEVGDREGRSPGGEAAGREGTGRGEGEARAGAGHEGGAAAMAGVDAEVDTGAEAGGQDLRTDQADRGDSRSRAGLVSRKSSSYISLSGCSDSTP